MKSVLTVFVWIAIAVAAHAADWPQWRGPDRTDISKETGLLKEWPKEGPPKVWMSKEAGLGYSGFAVVGDTLYSMGAKDDKEFLFALDVNDGRLKWSSDVGPLLTNNWGDGPRATPTVDGDLLYVLNGKGNLVCANTSDGAIVWQKTMAELGGKTPNWGYCESVLIDGEKAVCTPGGKQGALAAFNKKTGEPIWQSKDFKEDAQYSSIIVADHNGKRQYIQLMQKKLVGIDAENGNVLWVTDWVGRTAVIPTPIFHDGCVFITSGYGAGCKLVKLEPEQAVDVYQNTNMKNHHGGVILVGDYLYGFSDGLGWVCQDFKTGEVKWNEKSQLGKGCLTCADGMLYLVDEARGEVALIEASPEGYQEHGRFTLEPQTTQRKPSGRIWTHPTIADGKLYLRDQELLFCFDVKAK